MTSRASAAPNGGTGRQWYVRMLGVHGVQERRQPRAAATVGGVGGSRERGGNEGDTSPGTSSHVEWRAFERAIALERRGMRDVSPS